MVQGSVVTTDAGIDAALERAKEFDKEPRVRAAEYKHDLDVVGVHLTTTGRRLVIPREELQGLENASAAQLAEMRFCRVEPGLAAVGCGPLLAASAGGPVRGSAVDGTLRRRRVAA